VFDQTVTGPITHTWEDGGARISTLAYATTPDQRLLGLAEATRIEVQTNQNSGFESGTSPWGINPSNGTLVQSSTQAKEGSYSAQITPFGTAASMFIQSELISCLPGQAVTVNGWMWFTNAVTSNASMSVFWYTLLGVFISSSSNLVSVGAASWTQLTNTFTAPATAYFYSINPTLSGTPAATQIFYVDQVYATTLVTEQVSSVVQVPYPGAWPSGHWPPEGLVELG
jgi:hypothetical protein